MACNSDVRSRIEEEEGMMRVDAGTRVNKEIGGQGMEGVAENEVTAAAVAAVDGSEMSLSLSLSCGRARRRRIDEEEGRRGAAEMM